MYGVEIPPPPRHVVIYEVRWRDSGEDDPGCFKYFRSESAAKRFKRKQGKDATMRSILFPLRKGALVNWLNTEVANIPGYAR